MPKKITLEDLAVIIQAEFKNIYSEMKSVKIGINDRLDNIEERLDGVEERLGNVEERLDGMDLRLNRIEHSLLVNYRDRIESLEEKVFGKFGK